MRTDTVAQSIDHTLLKPSAGRKAILRLCEEALRYRFRTVCVNSVWVGLCREALAGTGIGISAVCGFPLGAMDTRAKSYEAAQAVRNGATEIDMVMQIGPFLEGDEETVRSDIAQVVKAVEGGAIVKVILETGLLTKEQIVSACRLAEEAGAHFVKTSTGFGPGGATEEIVRLMRGSVSEAVGVKASGGIRDIRTAIRMLEAGASRIGTSSGVAIVSGLTGEDAY